MARRLRADAARNRALVLEAARAAFAADGTGVPLDEIARRAGVGPGTVHRHFPSKQALLTAVVFDRLTELTEAAADLAAAEDPEAAFFDFLEQLVEQARENLALTAALDGEIGPEVGQAGAELTAALAGLLSRAQRAGAVKPDLTAGGLHAILGGAIAAERRLTDRERGLAVRVVTDGLRTRTRTRDRDR
jgi:AcrR family transcriptional regulator